MSTQKQILEFIKTLNPDAANEENSQENLLESGLLDSVAMMELVVWCEEHFEITIDMDDLTPENFATTEAIASYIDRQAA